MKMVDLAEDVVWFFGKPRDGASIQTLIRMLALPQGAYSMLLDFPREFLISLKLVS